MTRRQRTFSQTCAGVQLATINIPGSNGRHLSPQSPTFVSAFMGRDLYKWLGLIPTFQVRLRGQS